MNENINPTLRTALTGNYKFKLENYISRGFNITGRYTGGFMGYSFLHFLIIALVQSIPMIGFVIGPLFVAPALAVGYYIIANRISMNQDYDFENFFDGFKEVGSLALVALPTFIISTVIPLCIGYFLIDTSGWVDTFINDPNEFDPFAVLSGLSVGMFLLFIPILYFMIAWSFAPMFVIFYKMQPWEALETSRKLITKRWFTFFGFGIVLTLVTLAGFLLFCVGLLYFVPAVMNSYYVAFEDITKFYEDAEEDDILNHLVDN